MASMNFLDCRFSSPFPAHREPKIFSAKLLGRKMTYSGSVLVEQDGRISHAAWKIKQLARNQLLAPAAMEFIGRCLQQSPAEFAALHRGPDIRTLENLVREAWKASPDNLRDILDSAGVTIELMRMRNKLLFEGPGSAFAYYDNAAAAQKVHKAVGDEMHGIRISLHHMHGHFIFHPKTVALHKVIRERINGRCLVLCESREQAEILGSLGATAHIDVSNDPQAASLPAYSHLVLYSPLSRLQNAIQDFKGEDVIILAVKNTWEEGAYWHYVTLEGASRPPQQGRLGLGVGPDYES